MCVNVIMKLAAGRMEICVVLMGTTKGAMVMVLLLLLLTCAIEHICGNNVKKILLKAKSAGVCK